MAFYRYILPAALFVFSQPLFAELKKRPASEPLPDSISGYMRSPEFKFNVLSKRVLKPGSTLVDGSKVQKDDPACLMTVQIQTESHIVGPDPFEYSFNCTAVKGICPDPVDCASAKDTKKRWETVPVSSKADAVKNPLNDKCWETNSVKDQVSVFQFYDGSVVAEQACVYTYACSSLPAGSYAACPIMVESGKKVCSRLNSCLNNQVDLPKGATEKELAKLPAYERDELLKKLEAPASPYGQRTMAVSAVSSTSFQPRTANIVGSRTSVSNPPVSKPPATDHTGRGMK